MWSMLQTILIIIGIIVGVSALCGALFFLAISIAAGIQTLIEDVFG